MNLPPFQSKLLNIKTFHISLGYELSRATEHNRKNLTLFGILIDHVVALLCVVYVSGTWDGSPTTLWSWSFMPQEHHCVRSGRSDVQQEHHCMRSGRSHAHQKHHCMRSGRSHAQQKHHCMRSGRSYMQQEHLCMRSERSHAQQEHHFMRSGRSKRVTAWGQDAASASRYEVKTEHEARTERNMNKPTTTGMHGLDELFVSGVTALICFARKLIIIIFVLINSSVLNIKYFVHSWKIKWKARNPLLSCVN